MLTVFDEDVESRVKKWYERLSKMRVEPFTEEVSREVSKWYSDEYARGKLGYDGIVDVSILVVSHFNNPLKEAAMNFLKMYC